MNVLVKSIPEKEKVACEKSNFKSKVGLLNFCRKNLQGNEYFQGLFFKLLRELVDEHDNLYLGYYNLGLCYYYGWGTPKDNFQTFKLFIKAAEGSIPEAEYNCGLCFEHGCGVEKNVSTAIEYYKKAAKNGLELAEKKLSKILYKNSSIPNKTKVVLIFPAFD